MSNNLDSLPPPLNIGLNYFTFVKHYQFYQLFLIILINLINYFRNLIELIINSLNS